MNCDIRINPLKANGGLRVTSHGTAIMKECSLLRRLGMIFRPSFLRNLFCCIPCNRSIAPLHNNEVLIMVESANPTLCGLVRDVILENYSARTIPKKPGAVDDAP